MLGRLGQRVALPASAREEDHQPGKSAAQPVCFSSKDESVGQWGAYLQAGCSSARVGSLISLYYLVFLSTTALRGPVSVPFWGVRPTRVRPCQDDTTMRLRSNTLN